MVTDKDKLVTVNAFNQAAINQQRMGLPDMRVPEQEPPKQQQPKPNTQDKLITVNAFNQQGINKQRANVFDDGGSMFLDKSAISGPNLSEAGQDPNKSTLMQQAVEQSKSFNPNHTSGLGSLMGGLKGAAGGLVGAAAGAVGGLIGGGLHSGVGDIMGKAGALVSSIPVVGNTPIGMAVGAGLQVLGGVANAAFGSKLNDAKIAEVNAQNDKINKIQINDSSNDAVLDSASNINFGQGFNQKDIGKDGWFAHKAKDKYNELQRQRNSAIALAGQKVTAAADNAEMNADMRDAINVAAYGGQFNKKTKSIGSCVTPAFMPFQSNIATRISSAPRRYRNGGVYDVSPKELQKIKDLGYSYSIIE